MEVAKNIFKDGLVCDLAPESTGSSSLSYMLNGTLLTYNGNEFSLQNDMGNVKIEDAHLPEGFIPVGAKEHGGIIYVASYNPETKECLLGSFPSPETEIESGSESLPIVQIELKKYFEDPITQQKDILAEYTLFPGDSYEIEFTDDVFKKSRELIHYLLVLFTKTNVVINIPLELDENNKVSGIIDKKFSGKITLLSKFKMPQNFILNVTKQDNTLTVNKVLVGFSGEVIDDIYTTNNLTEETFTKTEDGFKDLNNQLVDNDELTYTPMIPVKFDVEGYDHFILLKGSKYYAIDSLRKKINLLSIYESTGILINTWRYLYDIGSIMLDCAFYSNDTIITDVVLNFYPQKFNENCNNTEKEFTELLKGIYGNFSQQTITLNNLTEKLYLVEIVINDKHHLYRWVFNNDWFNIYYDSESDYNNCILPNLCTISYDDFYTVLSSENPYIKPIEELTTTFSNYYTRKDALEVIPEFKTIWKDEILSYVVEMKSSIGTMEKDEIIISPDEGQTALEVVNKLSIEDFRQAKKTIIEKRVAIFSKDFPISFGVLCLGTPMNNAIEPLLLDIVGETINVQRMSGGGFIYDALPIYPVFVDSVCSTIYNNSTYAEGVYFGLIAQIEGSGYSFISDLTKIEDVSSITSITATDEHTGTFTWGNDTVGYYNVNVLKRLREIAEQSLESFKLYYNTSNDKRLDVPLIEYEDVYDPITYDGAIDLTFTFEPLLKNIPENIESRNLKMLVIELQFTYKTDIIKEKTTTTYSTESSDESLSNVYDLGNIEYSNKIVYLENKYITIPEEYTLSVELPSDPNDAVIFIVETYNNELLYGSRNSTIQFTEDQLNVVFSDYVYTINFNEHININLNHYVLSNN